MTNKLGLKFEMHEVASLFVHKSHWHFERGDKLVAAKHPVTHQAIVSVVLELSSFRQCKEDLHDIY